MRLINLDTLTGRELTDQESAAVRHFIDHDGWTDEDGNDITILDCIDCEGDIVLEDLDYRTVTRFLTTL